MEEERPVKVRPMVALWEQRIREERERAERETYRPAKKKAPPPVRKSEVPLAPREAPAPQPAAKPVKIYLKPSVPVAQSTPVNALTAPSKIPVGTSKKNCSKSRTVTFNVARKATPSLFAKRTERGQ